jgi:hypothetical protein
VGHDVLALGVPGHGPKDRGGRFGILFAIGVVGSNRSRGILFTSGEIG